MLADLGCHKIRLMMWSDRKIPGLEGFGIEVVERVRVPPRASISINKIAATYLAKFAKSELLRAFARSAPTRFRGRFTPP